MNKNWSAETSKEQEHPRGLIRTLRSSEWNKNGKTLSTSWDIRMICTTGLLWEAFSVGQMREADLMCITSPKPEIGYDPHLQCETYLLVSPFLVFSCLPFPSLCFICYLLFLPILTEFCRKPCPKSAVTYTIRYKFDNARSKSDLTCWSMYWNNHLNMRLCFSTEDSVVWLSSSAVEGEGDKILHPLFTSFFFSVTDGLLSGNQDDSDLK